MNINQPSQQPINQPSQPSINPPSRRRRRSEEPEEQSPPSSEQKHLRMTPSGVIPNQVVQALQPMAVEPIALPPITPQAVPNTTLTRIEVLVRQWQQGQNRASAIQEIRALYSPLTQMQRTTVRQALTNVPGVQNVMNELEQMRMLQEGLTSAITAYDRWKWRQFSLHSTLPNEVRTWLDAATPERVAALPQDLLNGTNLHRDLLDLFRLETAYRNQDVQAIAMFEFGASYMMGLREGFVNYCKDRILTHRGTDSQLAQGYIYYHQICNRCSLSNRTTLYDQRTSLSLKERRDCLAILTWMLSPAQYLDDYNIGSFRIGSRINPNFTLYNNIRAFLEIGIALETNNLQAIFRFSEIGTAEPLSLTAEDKRFFEQQYHITNWDAFTSLGGKFAQIQYAYDRLTTGQNLSEHEKSNWYVRIESIFEMLCDSTNEGENFDSICNEIFGVAPALSEMRPLINYVRGFNELERLNDAFTYAPNPTSEQQARHLIQSRTITQRMIACGERLNAHATPFINYIRPMVIDEDASLRQQFDNMQRAYEGYIIENVSEAEKRTWHMRMQQAFLMCNTLACSMRERYDDLRDQLLQDAEGPFRSFFAQVNSAINYGISLDELSRQLHAYARIAHPTIEQQNQHISKCHTLMQRIENFAQVLQENASPVVNALQPIIEDATLNPSAPLVKYKILIERFQGTSNHEIRKQIIWNLAKSAATLSPLEFKTLKERLATLYPNLATPLGQATNSNEFKYARLLIRLDEQRSANRAIDLDTVLSLQEIGNALNPTQCQELLVQFQQHIPNVDELYLFLRTDMGFFRQINLFQNPELTPTARTAILNNINNYRNRMDYLDPAHFTEIIQVLVRAPHSNREAKKLLQGILEARCELICRKLPSAATDNTEQSIARSVERHRCLFEIGEMLAEASAAHIPIRAEFLKHLRRSYPTFTQDAQRQVQFVQLFYEFHRSPDLSLETGSVLQLQEVTKHMSFDQCRELMDAMREHIPDFATRFPNAVTTYHKLNTAMDYLRQVKLIATSTSPQDLASMVDLIATSTSPQAQATHLTGIREVMSRPSFNYRQFVDMVKAAAINDSDAREMIRNIFKVSLELKFEDLRNAGSNVIEQNRILFEISDLLVEAHELQNDIRLLLGDIPASQILDDEATLGVLFERYYPSTSPSPALRLEEIECTKCLLLLQRYRTAQEVTSRDELAQMRARQQEVVATLGRMAVRMGDERYTALTTRLQAYRPEMQSIITYTNTDEFKYNTSYSLSANHYNVVRLDDTIPALPSTVNADTTFREGLFAFFNEIPFEELQTYLTERDMTLDTARDTLTRYINNVMNMAPLFGAPNPVTYREQARAWWNEIKDTIVHVILYIQNLHPPEHSETEIKKKKKELLATLIGAATRIGTGPEPCGGRYRAEAALLHQQIVLGVSVSFTSEVNRQLNPLRENNATILSVMAAQDVAGQPHEYIGFLRLIGHELAIPGTQLATRSDADISFTQTRMYERYGNNTAALRQRFEQMYTPFTIITCIEQEVGPQGSERMRGLFWEWCYAHVSVEPASWGITRSPDDWGGNLEAIKEHDAAKRVLREIRERLEINATPEAIDEYLLSVGIEREVDEEGEVNETVLQAVLRTYSIPRQRDAVLHEIRRLARTNTSPEKIDEYLRANGIIRAENESAEQAVRRQYPDPVSDEEVYASIITSERALTRVAFMERVVYEELPSRWTPANRLKVKRDFIAKMLAQMGSLTPNAIPSSANVSSSSSMSLSSS